MNTVLIAKCSLCGTKEKYELNNEEQATYEEYLFKGREMGFLQNLFPNVPSWIRSGAIDKYSNGFCICPKCNPFEEEEE